MKQTSYRIGATCLFLITFFAGCNLFTKKNPTIEEFYPDGTLKSESAMQDGKKNGTTKTFDRNGHLMSLIEYVNDQKEGINANYIKGQQKIYSKIRYHLDQKDGEATVYFENGKIYRITPYENDKINGIEKKFYDTGTLLSEEPYAGGYPGTGLKEYDESGKLLTDHPKIIINGINEVAVSDKFILKIFLSDHSTEVKFYADSLRQGKFTYKYMNPLTVKNGVVTLEFFVPRGSVIMKKLSFVAVTKTKFENTLVLQRDYNLMLQH